MSASSVIVVGIDMAWRVVYTGGRSFEDYAGGLSRDASMLCCFSCQKPLYRRVCRITKAQRETLYLKHAAGRDHDVYHRSPISSRR